MALDGLPLDLPHAFREVLTQDETVQIGLTLDIGSTEDFLDRAVGVIVIGTPRSVQGGTPSDKRVLRPPRRVVRR